jgi:ABC-type uncharacterized transport system permease subunit
LNPAPDAALHHLEGTAPLPSDLPTTIALILLTLLALAASVLSWSSLGQSGAGRQERLTRKLIWLTTAGCALLFVYREVFVHQRWTPFEAHVDGLLLIATLFGAALLFLESRARMKGLATFAMPILTLLLAWAICASWFTWHLFRLHSIWRVVHLSSVYLGLLGAAVAAIGGGMYLYVQKRLRHKLAGTGDTRLPSLEATERLIIRASAFGFALLSLGLFTGLVIIVADGRSMHPGWWQSPKIVLAAVVWSLYALVMNVRHATAFRGNRAAWLSIAGLLLVLTTFGVATRMPNLPRSSGTDATSRSADTPGETP